MPKRMIDEWEIHRGEREEDKCWKLDTKRRAKHVLEKPRIT